MNLSSCKYSAPTTFTSSLGAQPSPFLCADLAAWEFPLVVPSSLTGNHGDILRAFSLPFRIVWTRTMSSLTPFSSQSIRPSPGQEPFLTLVQPSGSFCAFPVPLPAHRLWKSLADEKESLAVGYLSTPASRRQRLEPGEQTDLSHFGLRATTQQAPAPLLTQAHISLFRRAVPWPPLPCVLAC